jgi:hypothetical protein
MTIRDAEVIELLADEPELLAIADAVSATQPKVATRRRRRRIVVRGGIVAAAAAAVIVAVLAAPRSSPPAVLGRALAAIGDGRIMHVVIESPSGMTYVNLKTGHRTAPIMRQELWVDRKGDRLHLVLSIGGRLLGDLLLPEDEQNGASSAAPTNPAFAALWTGYRAALSNGTAKLVGRGTVLGHRVYWLSFRPTSQGQPRFEVAVDAHTYKPVLNRTYVNGRHLDQRILVAKTIPYRPAEFERRGPSLVSGSSGGSSTGSGGPSGPATPPVLRAPWLTAGKIVAGLRLRGVSQFSEFTTVAGKRRSAHGVELTYGAPQPLSTTIDELLRPDDPRPWTGLPADSVRIEQGEESSGKGGAHRTWTGYLKKDGVYLTISTPNGEGALLAITRALHLGRK